jgi:hypothetical protein
MTFQEGGMIHLPNASGLVLCEQAVIEEKTRNVTLVNSFSRLRCPSFPSPRGRFFVYALLSGGLGDAEMSLVVSRLDTLEDVHETRWHMKFRDRLRPMRLVLRLSHLSFPEPVRYQFSLMADGEEVAQTVLEVSP